MAEDTVTPTAQEFRDMAAKVDSTLNWAALAEREGKVSHYACHDKHLVFCANCHQCAWC